MNKRGSKTRVGEQIFDLRTPGRSLRVHPPSFCAPLPGEQNRICSSGILWMYFDFVYGILFDGRIITRKTRKSHRNTENKKNRLDGTHVVSSPAPTRNPRKSTEYTKRGTGAGCSEGAASAEQVFEGNLRVWAQIQFEKFMGWV